jgi:hypothetical protein
VGQEQAVAGLELGVAEGSGIGEEEPPVVGRMGWVAGECLDRGPEDRSAGCLGGEFGYGLLSPVFDDRRDGGVVARGRQGVEFLRGWLEERFRWWCW